MKERYLAAASAEYLDAVAYYESCQPGLGDVLLAEIDEFLAIAHEFPLSGSAILIKGESTGTRALLLRTFPIKVVYAVTHDILIVVGIVHTSRRPGYWRARLDDLGA